MNRLSHTAFISLIFLSFFIHPPNVFSVEGAPKEVIAIALRNWPPQYVTNKGTGSPEGFAIDIMQRVAELSDLKVRYVVYDDWPHVFEALQKSEAVLAPNMGITDERLGLYDFTAPYETFRIMIFVRSATGDIHGASDLAGRTVGVVKANQGLVLMKARGGSDLEIFNSVEEALMGLLSGGVDALIYPESPFTGIARRSGLDDKIKAVGKPLQEIKRGIAVRKGEPELFLKLDNALRQLIKTPEYETIYQKWYGKPKAFWTVTRVVMGMGVVLCLTIAATLTWRYRSILRLNRALSEKEERLGGIIENSHAGYFFIDKKGKFQRVNTAWLEMHGYDSPDEVIGQPFTLTQVIADLEAAQQNVAALLAGSPIPSGESTRRRRNGSVGYHTFSAHPVVQDGRVVGLEGFVIDTTAGKQAELALGESEERFRTVSEQSPNMVFINKKGRIVYANDRCKEMLGYEIDEFYSPNFDFLSLLAPESLSQAELSFNRHMENIEVPPREYILTKKDGSRINTIINTKLIDYEGERAILEVVTDITGLKENEWALVNAKKQWEATFDAISDWVSIIDRNHNIIRTNKASISMVNLSPREVVGKHCYEIVHGTDVPVPDCPLLNAVDGGRPDLMEFQTQDGRWLQVSVDSIKSEGSDELFVHIVRDISARKQAEAEKAKIESQARQLQKAEGLARMAGAIAHHFNNQLSVVMGNLELILDSLPGEAEIRENLIEAFEAARRSSEVSRLMLTYLGIDTGKHEMLNLSTACREYLPLLQDIVPKKIALETDFLAPGAVVRTGKNQIRQVLVRLITNGVEAIGDGTGRLRLAAGTISVSHIPRACIAPADWSPADDSYACLEVTDTGCGMAAQDMEKIFDPFFSTKFTGRGIGLAEVLGIVKALNGAISVESTKDGGSTFRVLLPIVAGEVPVQSHKAAGLLKAEKGGTVLLVEDQAPVRKIAAAMLERLGFSVLAAAGGTEALELFWRHREMIRCVITDLTMPGMDGWETLAELREIQPDLPVILASGYDEAHAVDRHYSEQPNAFLHKPYSKDELKKVLNMAIGFEV